VCVCVCIVNIGRGILALTRPGTQELDPRERIGERGRLRAVGQFRHVQNGWPDRTEVHDVRHTRLYGARDAHVYGLRAGGGRLGRERHVVLDGGRPARCSITSHAARFEMSPSFSPQSRYLVRAVIQVSGCLLPRR